VKWFKIDGVGLINPTQITSGYWGSDVMIANNNTWTVVIPPNIAPGYYVIRHETIALHAAQSTNGAQNYAFCFNLLGKLSSSSLYYYVEALKTYCLVSGSGTNKPSGVAGTSLYKNTDPGVVYDVYKNPLDTYTVPGPALYTGAQSVTQTYPAAPTASASGVSKKRWEA